jgi:predicted dehydrogenase
MPSGRRQFLGQVAGVTFSVAAGALSAPGMARAQSRKTARIKIGQIGTGHAHASKLAVYRASPDYEVVGVVEADPALRQRAESQAVYQGLPWLSQEELLNRPDVQAVLVETPVRGLLDAAEAAINAGKHVHLDKPAGESLPQYERILNLAAKQNLMVQMGYMFRYNPGVVLLREFLRQGWLGELFEVHAVMSKVVGPSDRVRLAEYPGGILFELGCHVLDLVVGVLGAPDRVTGISRHSSPADDRLLDNMLAVLEYPRAIATVKSSAQEVDGGVRRQLVVCGTEGTLQIEPLDDPKIRLSLSRPRGMFQAGTQTVTLPKYTRYVDDAADMARVIRGEKPSDFSYAHDLLVQRTLLTACGLPLDR